MLPAMFAPLALGQQSVEAWKAPHFSIEPKALYQAASAVPAPEGANIVLLEDDESYTFDEAGRIEHVGYFVYKVLTQKGAEGWDYLAVGWDPWHQARPIIRARIITPDFAEHALDPKAITETPARGGDYKIYSDGKRFARLSRRLPPAQLWKGSTPNKRRNPSLHSAMSSGSRLGATGFR